MVDSIKGKVVMRAAENLPIVLHYGLKFKDRVIHYNGEEILNEKYDREKWPYEMRSNAQSFDFLLNNCEHLIKLFNFKYIDQFFRIFIIFTFLCVGFLHYCKGRNFWFGLISYFMSSFAINFLISIYN